MPSKEEFLQDLQLIQNPSLPNNKRLEILQKFENLKTLSKPEVLAISASLQTHDHLAEYYSYELLLALITRNEIQVADIIHIFQLAKPIRFITLKQSKVFCELAKRIWPLGWMDFDLPLRKVYSQHSWDQKLLVIQILKTLMQDVFIYDDYTASRRKTELSSSLIAITCDSQYLNTWIIKARQDPDPKQVVKRDLDLMIEIIRNDLDNKGWLFRCVQDIIQAASQSDYVQLKEFLLFLDCMLDWVPLVSIQSCNSFGMLIELLGMTNSVDIQELVLDCMTTLLQRQFNGVDLLVRTEMIWKNFFDLNMVTNLLQLWGQLHQTTTMAFDELLQAQSSFVPSSETCCRILKKFGQVLGLIGSFHVAFKGNTEIPKNYGVYQEFMRLMTFHPNVFVATSAVEYFADAIKHLSMKNEVLKEEFLALIVPGLVNQLGTNLYPQSVKEAYSIYDFDSPKDENIHSSILTTKRLEIIKVYTTNRPLLLFQWINNQLGILFTNPSSSTFTLLHLSTALETIVTGLPAQYLQDCSNSTNKEIFVLMQGLVSFINQTKFSTPEEFLNKMTMISAFSPWMEYIPSELFACTETYLHLSTFVQGNEVDALARGELLSDLTVQVRRKALVCLAKLGTSVPDMFIPHLATIGPAIVDLSKSRKLVKQETRILIEFLVVVVSGSKIMTNDEKKNVMGSVVKDDMDFLFSCGQTFTEFNGFARGLLPFPLEKWSNSDGNLNVDVIKEFNVLFEVRRDLYNTLLSVRHWMKRSCEVAKKFKIDITGLWADHQPKFLQVIFSLMENINTLFDPASWSVLPPVLKKILTLTPHERAMALGIDHEDAKGLNKPLGKTALETEIFRIWSWIGRCRDICYQSIQTVSQFPEFYKSDAVPHPFMNAFFSTHISLYHWRGLLTHALTPFILNCPKASFQAVLGPFLPDLAGHLNDKIKLAWASELNVITGHEEEEYDAADAADVSDEVVNEKILRLFTRAVGDLWQSIFGLASVTNLEKGAIPDFRNAPLVQFCVYQLVSSWSEALLVLLAVKDTSSCHSAILTSIRLVPVLVSNTETHFYLGDSLLKATLQVLHDGYQKSNHSDALRLIIDIYTSLRSVSSSIPFETLSQLPSMDSQALKAFESEIMHASTVKLRTATAKSFFSAFHGKEVSEWGNTAAGLAVFGNEDEKRIFKKVDRGTSSNSMLNKDEEIGLDGLFAEQGANSIYLSKNVL